MALDPVTTSFRIFQVVREGIRNKRAREMATVTLADGSQIERAEPILPGRTSTKVAVSGIAFGLPLIQWVQAVEMPWPWLETLTNSDLFAQIAAVLLAWAVARLSKSPAIPGTL